MLFLFQTIPILTTDVPFKPQQKDISVWQELNGKMSKKEMS